MSSTRFLNFILRISLRMLALGAFALSGALAQVSVTAWSPASKLVVGSGMQFSATVTDTVGTPLDGSTLAWSSGDSTIANVSSSGLVKAVFPGDVAITVTDPVSGASAQTPLHVIPASLSIQAKPQQFHVGETSLLTATATDVAGNPIPGVRFQFRSGELSVASVAADGTLTGIAEGFTSVEASIAGVASNPALEATLQIHVLPKLAYRLKKLISTDVTGVATIASVDTVSAVSSAEVAGLVTLSTGSQAAVLIEGGKPKVLAMVGQALPNVGGIVTHLDYLSANSKGDAVMLIQAMPNGCPELVLFLHNQPEQLLGASNCSYTLRPHSMGEDGSVVWRFNDQIFLAASATATPQLLFSLATQPSATDPITVVNDFTTGGGKFVLNASLKSGTHAYFLGDGKSLSRFYKDGDPVRGKATNNIDMPVAGADGTFYARANLTNFESVVQVTATGINALFLTGDVLAPGSSTSYGWVHGVDDVAGGLVLFRGDFAVSPNYHTSLAVWKASSNQTVEYTTLSNCCAFISDSLTTTGEAFFSGVIKTETSIPGLRSISSANGTPSLTLINNSNFPQAAPAGMDWRFPSNGGSASTMPTRSAGNTLIAIDSSIRTLFAPGSVLPNQKPALGVTGGIANQSGDLVFTAGYPGGQGLFRYRAGKLETVQDTAVTGSGPSGTSVSYFWGGRYRYAAINNKGDVAIMSQYGSHGEIVAFIGGAAKLVATQFTAAPGGSTFQNFNALTMDDAGRVLFTALTADGKTAVFFWNGTAVTRVIGFGDAGPFGMTVNEVSNIAAGGPGFAIMLSFGGYQIREIRSFDGQQMKTVVSTDTSLVDNTGVNYFYANQASLSANGDIHYLAATQDGGLGIYAHRFDGTEAIVARSRDQLPSGDWLVLPLNVSSSLTGEVYFTAEVINNGVESLALYQATPQ